MFDLKVTTTTGSVQVACLPVDFIAFENHFDKPVSALESGRLTYLYFLAWTASKRTGVTGLEFDEWVATVTSVEQADEDEIPPLGSSPSTGS